jgi:hypothetical protein
MQWIYFISVLSLSFSCPPLWLLLLWRAHKAKQHERASYNDTQYRTHHQKPQNGISRGRSLSSFLCLHPLSCLLASLRIEPASEVTLRLEMRPAVPMRKAMFMRRVAILRAPRIVTRCFLVLSASTSIRSSSLSIIRSMTRRRTSTPLLAMRAPCSLRIETRRWSTKCCSSL